MHIVIAGGSGFIGSRLVAGFRAKGDRVSVISRSHGDYSWSESDLRHALEGADVLINLAGRSINCRFTEKNKKEILVSRTESVKLLNQVVEKLQNPPQLWINASAAGIYEPSDAIPHTENSHQFSGNFLGEVVQKWESEFFENQISGVRKIALRTSVVLGENGGVVPLFFRLSRFGLGGKQGNGRQVFSWIHIDDYLNIVLFLMGNNQVEGVVNCTSPFPVTNKVLMKTIRQTLKIPFGLSAPEFVIRLSSRVLGIEPSLILDSSNVVPQRLTELNFKFKYPSLKIAIEHIGNFI